MPRPVRLTDEDPTIWGKCLPCSKTGHGTHAGTYYASAFPRKKWNKGPKCPNCKGPLTEIYRLKGDSK